MKKIKTICIIGTGYSAYNHYRSFKNLIPGKIYMLGSWQFNMRKSFNFDLFWNSESFQAMEPAIVENYLSIIRNKADYIYLNQNMNGMPTGKIGTLRVLEKTTDKTYLNSLSNYNLINRSEAFYPLTRAKGISGNYEYMFFEKVNKKIIKS